MKRTAILLVAFAFTSCVERIERKIPYSTTQVEKEMSNRSPQEAKKEVEDLLDQWHLAAAEADFEGYFGSMAENSIYIGTDATENWNREEFKAFSKPYFDRGNAWDFTVLERNTYISESGSLAWFDELLDTHMGLTRGSGVVALEDDTWKIKHYVLSLAIPNDNLEQIKAVNREIDSSFISRFGDTVQ